MSGQEDTMKPTEDASLTSVEREIEAALVGLTPAAAGVDLERIAWEAGRRSSLRATAAWRGLSVAASVAALAMGAVLVAQPGLPMGSGTHPGPSSGAGAFAGSDSGVTAPTPVEAVTDHAPVPDSFAAAMHFATALGAGRLTEDGDALGSSTPLVAIDRAGSALRARPAAMPATFGILGGF